MDFIIPYVNCNDEFWKEEFTKYGNKMDDSFLGGITRYRDQGILKYLLRSIDKYTPWVDNVYLLVAYELQIPIWINRDTVKIIYHKDFIPERYLPVFNSNHIETFLGLLPNERFVWFNDDLVINKPMGWDKFFLNDTPVYDIEIRRFNPNAPGDMVRLNSYNLILNSNQKHFVVNTKHVTISYRKDLCRECFDKYKFETTLGELHKPRQHCNINQYAYALYQWTKTAIAHPKTRQLSIKSTTLNRIDGDFDWFILNDGELNEFELNTAINWLENKFPNKSKYETIIYGSDTHY